MIPAILFILATTASTAVLPDACSDAEALLMSAPVVSVKDLGQGITGAQKIELKSGDCELTALFKTVHIAPGADFYFGPEKAPFSDSYQYEIAAYEIDKLLGFGLVAPVVERTINGEKGSIQLWVTGKLHRFVHGQKPPDRTWAENQTHAVRLFDYLIFNTDRHIWNFYFMDGWQPLAIDHSIAFHTMTTPYRPLYRFPRPVMERIRNLNKRQLKKALGRYLEKDQIKALDRRRRIVLELADKTIKAEGEPNVLFEWEGPFADPDP